MQSSLIGVGPALRKARLARRKSLDEAGRETRIRVEYLEALERETFSELNGEVYVRGSLRTYAAYLGLNPDKVIAAYARSAFEPADPADRADLEFVAAPPPRSGTSAPVVRRGRHGIALLVAAFLIVAAVAAGLISRSDPVPVPLTPSPDAVANTCGETGVTVAITPREPVAVRILSDGRHTFGDRLQPGRTRTFVATDSITVHLSRGGAALVSVDCTNLGAPGTPGQPWETTYTAAGPGGTSSTVNG